MFRKHDVVRLRTRLGLSQEKFAEKLGVSVSIVGKWEAWSIPPCPRPSNKTVEKESGQALTPETIFCWLLSLASACAFFFSYGMVEDLIPQ
jgi:transcriptional regulator with XRE-family HTH domain